MTRSLPVSVGSSNILHPTNDCVDGVDTVGRVFSLVSGLQEPNSKAVKSGFNRVAASTYDRDSWITVISRLATRSLSGLATEETAMKPEGSIGSELTQKFLLGDSLRESMFRYVLDDWRKRLDVAVSWLNEEWYNDQVTQESNENGSIGNYRKWVLRVFDGILPYLDAKDKVLIRFLSEIPSIDSEILERVKRLARDPERVPLAVNAIQYVPYPPWLQPATYHSFQLSRALPTSGSSVVYRCSRGSLQEL